MPETLRPRWRVARVSGGRSQVAGSAIGAGRHSCLPAVIGWRQEPCLQNVCSRVARCFPKLAFLYRYRPAGIAVLPTLLKGIHRYQSLMEPGHTQLLRLSANRFAEGLPTWVSRLTSGLRNRRHFNGNAAPRTIVKSCSVDEEALNRIAAAIRAPGMLMSSAEKLGQESVFASLRDRTSEAEEQRSSSLGGTVLRPRPIAASALSETSSSFL